MSVPAAATPHPGATIPPGVWVPVAATTDLGVAPLAVRAFGTDLAVWRDASGLHALVDRCPHRGARLSLGRPSGPRQGLQCAYHGWTFDGDGRCLHIPSQPGFEPPAGHRAQAWLATAQHDLVWVCESDAGSTPPALDMMPSRRILSGPFTVATSAPRVVENFLDIAHFQFVHPGTLGAPGQPPVPDHTVTTTGDGRPCIESVQVWQPRATASASHGLWVDYRYEVLGPYSALLSKQPGDGVPGDAYALFALPIEETETRVWFIQGTADITTPDQALRAFQHAVFAEDRPVLESQRPQRLPLDRSAERHCAADRLATAYRDWLRAGGVSYGTC